MFLSQFSIDELRKQMDFKHNIRNMSVIAHVDHVSARSLAHTIASNIPEVKAAVGGEGFTTP